MLHSVTLSVISSLLIILLECVALARSDSIMRQMWTTPVLKSNVADNYSMRKENICDSFLNYYNQFNDSNGKILAEGETISDAFYRYQQRHHHQSLNNTCKISEECSNNFYLALSTLKEEIFVPAINNYLKELYITKQAVASDVFAWVSVHANGSFHTAHHHQGSAVSGVFYLSVPTSDVGDIVFYDPRGSLPPFGKTLHIKPSPGDLVLFPGWLVHEVLPTLNRDARLSVSFNWDGVWELTSDSNIGYIIE